MITHKRENYRLWQSGEFGNKLRAWDSLEAWQTSGFKGSVAIRQRAGRGTGLCKYDVPWECVAYLWHRYRARGYTDLILNEMAPSECTFVQGEYLNDIQLVGNEPCWGYFWHSFEPLPMRSALQQRSYTTHGLQTELLLRRYMSSASYEDWQALVTKYPGHVFEVSIFDCFLGDLPYRNALVWEVRRY